MSILEALALARAGEEKKALALALNLNQRFPEETLLNEYWLPTIRAAVELNRGADSQAIEVRDPTRPYELAVPPLPSNVLLYPVYLRGEAYLAMGLTPKRKRNLRKSSITAAWLETIFSEHWLAWVSVVPTRWKRESRLCQGP